MLNKNDPLIGVVQEVMKKNQAERDATKLVNEKFGVTDRKALPHEKQGEWDAAYKSVLTEGKSLAALAPPHDKVTHKDVLVGRGVLKKQGNKHVLAKEELSAKQKLLAKVGQKVNKKNNPKVIDAEDLHAARKGHASHIEEDDTTSPSSMGIKKPDYAPAGTTPDYAKPKEQTVNRAAKTSLPPGTVKEETLEEKAVSKAQHRFFGLVRGIQKGKAHGSAKAEKAASSMSAKSVKDYAKTKEKGLPEKISEAGPGYAGAGSQVKGQSQYGKQSQVSYGNIPAIAKASELAKSGSGVGAAMSGFTPPASAPMTRSIAAAKPAPVVKTRPDVPVGSLPAAKPAARTNAGVTKLNADSAARQQAAKIGNQTGGVNTAANSTAPKAPKPTVKPARPAAKVAAKPASKVMPVKKAVPAPAPAAVKAKGTAVTRMRQQRQRDKNNLVGPGNS